MRTNGTSAKARLWVALLVGTVGANCLAPAMGYTPESPKVREMADRAVKYLEKAGNTGNAGKLGGETLVALAIHKYYKKYGGGSEGFHPKVEAALKRARAAASNLAQEDNYSVGIALIFLTEVDYENSVNEIGMYMTELLRRQKPHGGWGYEGTQTGDTSQTQYAVLGAWSAYHAGVNVPVGAMEKVAYWLVRTQDPSGGWGYQGRDPGSFSRVPQEEITNSLHAAGLGSLYVCADFLGFSKGTPEDERKQVVFVELPPALEPVFEVDEEAQKKNKRVKNTTVVDPGRLNSAFQGGNGWYDKNYKIPVGDWQYYYIYALERYQSFRELVEGNFPKEPKWYNEGVDFLGTMQNRSDGSYGASAGGTGATGGAEVDTAFAVLFLIRSTRETLDRVVKNQGVLIGGYGLPKDLAEARLSRDGKVVAPKVTVDVSDLMEMLEEDDTAKFEEMVTNPDAFSIGQMKGNSADYTNRLQRVLRSGSWQARILAAKTLGQQGDLDNVPILIYALTDPQPLVVQAARDGLRLTSRRFEGFGLPDDPNPEQVRLAIEKWKVWYRSIRPDAAFIEPGVASEKQRGTSDDTR